MSSYQKVTWEHYINIFKAEVKLVKKLSAAKAQHRLAKLDFKKNYLQSLKTVIFPFHLVFLWTYRNNVNNEGETESRDELTLS